MNRVGVFAVVADEVRNLAGKTQKSTEEITGIIEKLQERAKETGIATQKCCDLIMTCVDLAKDAGKDISEIQKEIFQIATMNTQIASACNEQSSVTDELGRNIEVINQASEEVAEGSNHTAKACTELADLATQLNENVSKFKLS